jgi:hypothetical protein
MPGNQTPTALEQFFQLLIRLGAPVGTLITDSTPYDQIRRPVLNLIGATYADDPVNGQGVLTLGAGDRFALVRVNHSTSPITMAALQRASADVSGGTVVVKAPASPADSDPISIKATLGNPAVNSLTADGNGHTIEDPAAHGTFSATVLIGIAGESITWQFDSVNNRWMIV